MVSPSWGSFEKPNQNYSSNADQEFKEEIPGKIKDKLQPEGKKPQWGEFLSPQTYQGEIDPTEEESLFGYMTRNIVSNTSRLMEQSFGRYGNIQKMGKDILSSAPKMGGILGWAISELVGPENWERMIKGSESTEEHQKLKKSIKENFGFDLSLSSSSNLPTSEQLKEISQKLTGGYTEPKTKGEKRFQQKIEDIGATVSRRTFRQPTLRNIGINNLLIPSAANVTKDIVEDLGFGENKANMAKAAVWLPLSLAANVNASQYAANLMNEGRNGFNPNLSANVHRYQNNINNISRNMLQGDPRSTLAIQQISGINDDIASGRITIRDLMTRYDALNAAKRDRGLFDLNISDRRIAIRNINQVRDAIRNEIEHLGQSNPQALESWRNGVQAFSTIHRSNAITNWIQSISKGPYSKLLSGPAAALFGITSYGGLKSPLVSLPIAVGAPLLYKSGQTIYRIFNDRNLANYYWRAIGAAQAENVPAFISNYEKLNKKIEDSDSTEKKTKPKKK